MSVMNIILAIDDTDIINTRGTGHLAQELAEKIRKNGWGKCSAISRHQLFVHEDIPYTSHNSAMCFEVTTSEKYLKQIIAFTQNFLETNSAQGSDPGLCVVVRNDSLRQDKLMDFGKKAKRTILTKEDAYGLAKNLGIHLSEHGGTGQGVVGALAGIGLRLSGNDGRFRGWHFVGKEGDRITVKKLCANEFIDAVKTTNGENIGADITVVLGGDKLKTVFQDSKQVVLVSKNNSDSTNIFWKTLTKQEVKQFS